MKTAARKLSPLSLPLRMAATLVVVVLPMVSRAAPAPVTRDLLSHGSERDYWAANVTPDPDPRPASTRC